MQQNLRHIWGGDMMHYRALPVRHLGGRVPPVPCGIYATDNTVFATSDSIVTIAQRRANAVPIVKVFKKTKMQDFAITTSRFLWRWYPRTSANVLKGAWMQTPISAWLASVPIVPVLRNDLCHSITAWSVEVVLAHCAYTGIDQLHAWDNLSPAPCNSVGDYSERCQIYRKRFVMPTRKLSYADISLL